MWNYRILKRETEGHPDQYGLFEVMYNDSGKIFAHTEEAEIIAESTEELIKTLELMLSDAKKSQKDVLVYDKIEFHEPCEDGNQEEFKFGFLND